MSKRTTVEYCYAVHWSHIEYVTNIVSRKSISVLWFCCKLILQNNSNVQMIGDKKLFCILEIILNRSV